MAACSYTTCRRHSFVASFRRCGGAPWTAAPPPWTFSPWTSTSAGPSPSLLFSSSSSSPGLYPSRLFSSSSLELAAAPKGKARPGSRVRLAATGDFIGGALGFGAAEAHGRQGHRCDVPRRWNTRRPSRGWGRTTPGLARARGRPVKGVVRCDVGERGAAVSSIWRGAEGGARGAATLAALGEKARRRKRNRGRLQVGPACKGAKEKRWRGEGWAGWFVGPRGEG